jgi:ubiquitin carboxyl-terminal hydrolase L5
MSIDPESRGYTIGQTDEIRIAHNSFSRPETFGATDKPLRGAKSEDVYHFISYVPCNGVVYELDGLRDGPIIIGSIPEGANWLDVARPAVQQRMGLFAASETHFALMKIVRKPLSVLEEKLSIRMSLPESEMNELAMQELRLQIDEENDKLRRYKVENERRRHNYLPLAFSLFRNLAAAGKLTGLRDSAREKSQQRAANAKK